MRPGRVFRALTPEFLQQLQHTVVPTVRHYTTSRLVPSASIFPRQQQQTRTMWYEDQLRSELGARWQGFQPVQSVVSETNPITGEVDMTLVEIDPGARDRLLQIVSACKPGTYGFFMAKVLRKIVPVVGNFCSAQIDEFFAQRIDKLNSPFTDTLNQKMADDETAYWRAQFGLERVAGMLLNENTRAWLMWFVAGNSDDTDEQ